MSEAIASLAWRAYTATHIVLTEWERDVLEQVLHRPVVEGEKILGAKIVFACEVGREVG